MEEEHGLARHAMQVYSRATKAVPPEEKLAIYNIYLQHAQQIYGITKTREIYQVKGQGEQGEYWIRETPQCSILVGLFWWGCSFLFLGVLLSKVFAKFLCYKKRVKRSIGLHLSLLLFKANYKILHLYTLHSLKLISNRPKFVKET